MDPSPPTVMHFYNHLNIPQVSTSLVPGWKWNIKHLRRGKTDTLAMNHMTRCKPENHTGAQVIKRQNQCTGGCPLGRSKWKLSPSISSCSIPEESMNFSLRPTKKSASVKKTRMMIGDSFLNILFQVITTRLKKKPHPVLSRWMRKKII